MSKFTLTFIQYFYQVTNIYNNINNIMHCVLLLTKLLCNFRLYFE